MEFIFAFAVKPQCLKTEDHSRETNELETFVRKDEGRVEDETKERRAASSSGRCVLCLRRGDPSIHRPSLSFSLLLVSALDFRTRLFLSGFNNLVVHLCSCEILKSLDLKRLIPTKHWGKVRLFFLSLFNFTIYLLITFMWKGQEVKVHFNFVSFPVNVSVNLKGDFLKDRHSCCRPRDLSWNRSRALFEGFSLVLESTIFFLSLRQRGCHCIEDRSHPENPMLGKKIVLCQVEGKTWERVVDWTGFVSCFLLRQLESWQQTKTHRMTTTTFKSNGVMVECIKVTESWLSEINLAFWFLLFSLLVEPHCSYKLW